MVEPSTDLRRRKALQAIGLGITGGLAGCIGNGNQSNSNGSSGGGNSGNNTVRVLSGNPVGESALKSIISDFESQTKYTIDLTYTQQGSGIEEAVNRLEAANNVPDVINWSGVAATTRFARGKLEPITEIVKKNNLIDPISSGGESYLAPMYIYPALIWYRSDLYQKAPNTWRTALSEIKRIQNEHGIGGFSVPSGNTGYHSVALINALLWQNGVQIYRGTTDKYQIVLDNDENRTKAIETLKFVKKLSRYAPNGSGWSWDDSVNSLSSENVSAIPSIGGIPPVILSANKSDLANKIKPTLTPGPAQNDMERFFSIMEGPVLRNDGDNTEGGRKWIDFYFSKDKYVLDYVLSAPPQLLPPKRELLQSERWKNNDTIKEYPQLTKLVYNNFGKLTGAHEVGNRDAPLYNAAVAGRKYTLGGTTDQLLINNQSPSESITWTLDQLKSIGKHP